MDVPLTTPAIESAAESPTKSDGIRVEVPQFKYILIAAACAVSWTLLGLGLSALLGSARVFLDEWVHLQGFFLVGVGTWLALITRSRTFERRLEATLVDGAASPAGIGKSQRAVMISAIGTVGTLSLAFMGFNIDGPLRFFMWTTCLYVCVVAGYVTCHMIDVIVRTQGLEGVALKVFRYSPARTRELRELVDYFTWFSLLMTVGYGFALAATFAPNWRGDKTYITVVRMFWPFLYVPLCSIALVFPHIIVHRLVRREKDSTLLAYQRQIDGLLADYRTLSDEEIGRTNTLASLFDRINSTPDYVLDLGIAIRTALPLVFNIVTLWAKPLFEQSRT